MKRVCVRLLQVGLTVVVTWFIFDRVGVDLALLGTLNTGEWRPRPTLFLASCLVLLMAVQSRDLPHVHLAMAGNQAAFGMVRFAVSPEFCRYVTPDRPPGMGPRADTNLRKFYCSDQPLPGGEYGAAINRLVETFDAEFIVRSTFPPGMTPEELLEGLTYVQPAIVELFNETLAALDAIEPPPEYQVGHEVLRDSFSELLSTARAIDRAVANGDNEEVRREFDRSNQIVRNTKARLPENYRPLVKAILGEE